jgi:hypothetical protein
MYNLSFISGKNDQTCFHYGVSLENWKTADSSCQEHAKWSRLAFVSHIKGPEYVLNSAGTGKVL